MNSKSLPESATKSRKKIKLSSSIEIDNAEKGEKQLPNVSLQSSGNMEHEIKSLHEKVDAMSAKIMQLESELLALKNAPDGSSDISGKITIIELYITIHNKYYLNFFL
jgi:hypothetical protein